LGPFIRTATAGKAAASTVALGLRHFGHALIPRSKVYSDLLSARNGKFAYRTEAKRLDEQTGTALAHALNQLIANEFIIEICREMLSRRGTTIQRAAGGGSALTASSPFNFITAFQLLDRSDSGTATASDFKEFLKAYQFKATDEQVLPYYGGCCSNSLSNWCCVLFAMLLNFRFWICFLDSMYL
jgi:hypothetical protein